MKSDFLAEIVAQKRRAITALSAREDVARWQARALAKREGADRYRLRQALHSPAATPRIIAEFKRRSPSRGLIRDDLSPSDAARAYERAGACGVSVLTDENFGGSTTDLQAVRASTQLPILCKDFLLHQIQIYEAGIAGADAVLLIAAILDERALGELRAIAEDKLGLDALVEVHTSTELQRSSDAGARLIGINNRDLRTFEVSLKTSEHLIAQAPSAAVMISESGLRTADQLRELHALGFSGFLVGEALMQARDPGAALRKLIEQFNRCPTPA